MRILVNQFDLTAHGGQERSLFDTVRGLRERGHHITLLYGKTGDLGEQYARVVNTMTGGMAFAIQQAALLTTTRDLAQAVVAGVRTRPDVVYVNQYQDSFYGALVAGATGAALVCHLRQPAPRGYRKQWMAGMHRVDRFIAVSEHLADGFVATGVDRAGVDVVPIAIDTDHFRPDAAGGASWRAAHGVNDEEFVVLFLGRLDREKGIEVLIDAARLLTGPTRLVVAGDPRVHPTPAAGAAYAASLRARARGLSAVWIQRQLDVRPLLAAADVVVMPSVWDEPMGRVPAEAMSSGRPVAVSATGGTPEMLRGPWARFLVPRNDAPALAAAIDGLRFWRTTEPGLGQAAREWARAHHTIGANVSAVENSLTTALAARKSYGRVGRHFGSGPAHALALRRAYRSAAQT